MLLHRLSFLCGLLFLAGILPAQSSPKQMPSRQNETVAYAGNLNEGQALDDLSWAWNSSVACFVEPRADHFRGNHAFYLTELPPYSTLVITLIPLDQKQDLSLYAYSGSGGSLPPALYRCVSCEADFRDDQPRVRKREIPKHARQVELRSARNPYPVTIGVSGPAGAGEGAFQVQLSLRKNR